MTIRSAVVFTMLITAWNLGMAQHREEEPQPHIGMSVKLDLTNAVNPIDPGLLLGVELPIGDKYSFTQEVGWILGLRDEVIDDQDFTGFKIREEVRMYGLLDVPGGGYYYFGLNAFYRYLNMEDGFTVGYGCSNDFRWSCDYVQFVRGKVTAHQIGGLGKFGIRSQVTDRLFIEADAGLGISYQTRGSLPIDGHLVDEDGNRFYGEDYLGSRPYAAFNARLGYLFK